MPADSTKEQIDRPSKSQTWVKRVDKVLITCLPIAAIISILMIPQRLGIRMWTEQYLAVFLGIVLISTFLSRPVKEGRPAAQWYDIVLALLSLAMCAYLFVEWPKIVMEGSYATPTRIALGIVAVGALMEATRRLFGKTLVILVGFFIFYALFTELFPSPFYGKGIPWTRLSVLLYLDKNALIGPTLDVAATMVLPFVLFGQLLVSSGGGKFLTDTALAIFGRMRGGPAKVPLVASCFFGSLSGVAVANVYTTGQITIPMMKKYGIGAHVAAAIEATASTGGLVLPPVMGVVAFIMAVFLNTTYAKICVAAVLPAIFYFIAVYIQIDRYSASRGFGPLPPEDVPAIGRTLKENWYFLLPLGLLVYFLFGTTLLVERAALYSCGAIVVIMFFSRKKKLSLSDLLSILETTGRSISAIGVVCALSGFLIGVVMFTGVGFSLTRSLVSLSGGYLLPLLCMTAVICVILGMGMPIVTVYILAVMLVVPALSEVGVPEIASHMFVLYYSMLSFLTPPVMLSVYVAASIAHVSPWKAAWPSLRLAIAAYVVPFAFVLNPALIFQGTYGQIITSALSALIAITVISIGLEGFLLRRMHIFARVLCVGAGLAMLWPKPLVLLLALAVAVLTLGFEVITARYQVKRGVEQLPLHPDCGATPAEIGAGLTVLLAVRTPLVRRQKP